MASNSSRLSPRAVLPTPAMVAADPRYWISGQGRALAAAVECDHGYTLVDSCPGCDYDDEEGQ